MVVGKKEQIQIPCVDHSRYDCFKQNVKEENVIKLILDTISSINDDNNYSSSIIHLCRYLAKTYEYDFISAVGVTGLAFSGQISAVNSASMMSDIGLNISYLCILLRILQNNLGTKMFEPKYLMKDLNGDMILPKFGEYNYYHEVRSKLELILFRVRDIVAVYKKYTQMIIDSDDIAINKMNRRDIVIGDDHGQGLFRSRVKHIVHHELWQETYNLSAKYCVKRVTVLYLKI